MVERFVRWYVHKHWKDEYIHKNQLADAFASMRKDVEEEKDVEWKEKIERMRIALERDHYIELTAERDKVEQARKKVRDAEVRVKKANDMHFCAITGAQGNLQISSELAIRIKETGDVLMDLFGSLKGIETNAESQLKVLEDSRKKINID